MSTPRPHGRLLTFFLAWLRRSPRWPPMCRAALSEEVAAVKKEKKALKKRLRKLEAAMEDKEVPLACGRPFSVAS